MHKTTDSSTAYTHGRHLPAVTVSHLLINKPLRIATHSKLAAFCCSYSAWTYHEVLHDCCAADTVLDGLLGYGQDTTFGLAASVTLKYLSACKTQSTVTCSQ